MGPSREGAAQRTGRWGRCRALNITARAAKAGPARVVVGGVEAIAGSCTAPHRPGTAVRLQRAARGAAGPSLRTSRPAPPAPPPPPGRTRCAACPRAPAPPNNVPCRHARVRHAAVGSPSTPQGKRYYSGAPLHNSGCQPAGPRLPETGKSGAAAACLPRPGLAGHGCSPSPQNPLSSARPRLELLGDGGQHGAQLGAAVRLAVLDTCHVTQLDTGQGLRIKAGGRRA
jgi:hypothetical protein